MYKSLPTLFITALILLISALPVTANNADPEENEKYEQRLNELKEYFRSEGMVIDQLLEDSRFEVYESIGDRFRNSAERKTVSLEQYKGILGFEAKKTQIAVFMDENREQLEKAEQEYDIPKYVIAAIIGIESDYGRNIGSYNPFNSYVSMYAVDYRADFARAQLKELIEFVNRKNIDVFELKSSYAGAMSFAQFIPYSINKWWVGDDIFDMNNNIMSVGNYLAYFKERTGSIDRAVFRYNPSELYTSAVLALADEASKM
jgi:membrane-bound lytic murein transglycosylase B